MRGKGCQITSLTSNLAVSNYPERTVSEDDLEGSCLITQSASSVEAHSDGGSFWATVLSSSARDISVERILPSLATEMFASMPHAKETACSMLLDPRYWNIVIIGCLRACSGNCSTSCSMAVRQSSDSCSTRLVGFRTEVISNKSPCTTAAASRSAGKHGSATVATLHSRNEV